MKIFLLFLLNTTVVTAIPYVSKSDEKKLQHVLLEEIIQSTKDLKDLLKKDVFVQNVIVNGDCTRPNFCKAGKILGMFEAEELGLNQKDWLLPRQLVAYTRDHDCNGTNSEEQVQLHQLLDNIHQCAQKEFLKTSEI